MLRNLAFAVSLFVCTAQLLGEVAAQDPDPLSNNSFYVITRNIPCGAAERSSDENVKSGIFIHCYDLRDKINRTCNLNNATICLADVQNRCVKFFMCGYNTITSDPPAQDFMTYCTANYPSCICIVITHYNLTGNPMDSIEFFKLFYFWKACSYMDLISKNCVTDLFITAFNKAAIVDAIFGHSLGCHFLGLCGEIYKSITGNVFPTIVCADPAGLSCFNCGILKSIKSGQSNCTICSYCNRGGYATVNLYCDVNIIVNNGWKQPNCPEVLMFDYSGGSKQALCGHFACVNATMKLNNATECDSYANFKSGACAGNYVGTTQTIIDTCRKGKYYTTTN